MSEMALITETKALVYTF